MNYKGNNLSYQYINKILSVLTPVLENKYDRMRNQGLPKKTYLIISDNNSVKPYFRNYVNCVYYNKGVTHLGISDNGEGAAVEASTTETAEEKEKKLLDTLLDFYIMQHASAIIAVTPYQWGSGFSEMAATTFCVPYRKFII